MPPKPRPPSPQEPKSYDELTSNDEVEIIRFYEKYPCLYDPSDEFYYYTSSKNKKLEKLANQLNTAGLFTSSFVYICL